MYCHKRYLDSENIDFKDFMDLPLNKNSIFNFYVFWTQPKTVQIYVVLINVISVIWLILINYFPE